MNASNYLLARALTASVFIAMGLSRVLAWYGILGVVPQPPSVLFVIFGGLELLAGLLIVMGWAARSVALAMVLFVLVDAVLAHPFWRADGAAMFAQLTAFAQSLSIMGGLLLVVWGETRRSRWSLR